MVAALMLLQFWQAPSDRELAEDIELALSRAGLDTTKAAYTMDLDPAQWNKQRQGVGHISAYRLARLGPEFWREFLSLRAERLGYTVLKESDLTSALLQVMAMAGKRMATMGLRQERKERAS